MHIEKKFWKIFLWYKINNKFWKLLYFFSLLLLPPPVSSLADIDKKSLLLLYIVPFVVYFLECRMRINEEQRQRTRHSVSVCFSYTQLSRIQSNYFVVSFRSLGLLRLPGSLRSRSQVFVLIFSLCHFSLAASVSQSQRFNDFLKISSEQIPIPSMTDCPNESTTTTFFLCYSQGIYYVLRFSQNELQDDFHFASFSLPFQRNSVSNQKEDFIFIGTLLGYDDRMAGKSKIRTKLFLHYSQAYCYARWFRNSCGSMDFVNAG